VGRELAARVEVERLSQAPRRAMGVVGVAGGGGVMGLEVKGPVWQKDGGASERPMVARRAGEPASGVEGSGLKPRGAENAEPMSESVSERTCIRIDGAM
jgi:hypothetical protein